MEKCQSERASPTVMYRKCLFTVESGRLLSRVLHRALERLEPIVGKFTRWVLRGCLKIA
jgi:hypothetical protein